MNGLLSYTKRLIHLAVWYYLMGLLIYVIFSFPLSAEPMQSAKLQWLDKVTARISDVELNVMEKIKIGTLEITLRHCDRTPPQKIPESTALLTIIEQKPQQETTALFSGWMFASSPAVNSLEHPVYDLWLVECK